MCSTCAVSSTNCSICKDDSYGTILKVSSSCVCKDGYYYDNRSATAVCTACDSLCLACVTDSTNCQSCNTSKNAMLSGNKCVCSNGYYLTTMNICNGIKLRSLQRIMWNL